MDLERLQRQQDTAFATDGPVVTSPAAAERFLERVGIALRYGHNPGIPLPGLQTVFGGAEPGTDAMIRGMTLSNGLLARGTAIEVHVVADRVAFVHRSLVPPLYALVRRGRALDDFDGITLNARTALALITQRKEATTGDVRHRLGLPVLPRHDPAYIALSELTRVMLVDRGPFGVNRKGIPYLPKEGYPYHLLHQAHPEIVRAAARYSIEKAADAWLSAYLKAAVFARRRKLASMFKVFLSPAEIAAAVDRLVEKNTISLERAGAQEYIVSR
ncbi:MAG TPA: hypothetical protein VEL79_16740 [Vicinamibacterales bacterium]|nr:hypothetical protein [Vicinamibacterales bacterium]